MSFFIALYKTASITCLIDDNLIEGTIEDISPQSNKIIIREVQNSTLEIDINKISNICIEHDEITRGTYMLKTNSSKETNDLIDPSLLYSINQRKIIPRFVRFLHDSNLDEIYIQNENIDFGFIKHFEWRKLHIDIDDIHSYTPVLQLITASPN